MQHQQPPPPGAYPPGAYPPGAYPPGGPYVQPPPAGGGGMSWLAIVAIVGVIGVFVLGILAAIAVPAFVKYVRRSKTSEARVQIAKIFDSIAAYHAEHGRCPGDSVEGSAGITPPLSVRCGDGPQGRCEVGSPGLGSYDASLWSDNPVWSELGFRMESSHYYHYDVRWSGNDNGACEFAVQAFGDLDDDGTYSTFERSGAADATGINAAAGLYIDQEIE